jgi:hypothetical protein
LRMLGREQTDRRLQIAFAFLDGLVDGNRRRQFAALGKIVRTTHNQQQGGYMFHGSFLSQ